MDSKFGKNISEREKKALGARKEVTNDAIRKFLNEDNLGKMFIFISFL